MAKIYSIYDKDVLTRFDLDVPYAEKDVAKKLGAKWDSEKKTWYIEIGSMSYLEFWLLAKWTRRVDMRFLECPNEHREYAQLRGALIDYQTDKLFVPAWFSVSQRAYRFLYRLCYWLPDCADFREDDRSRAEFDFCKNSLTPDKAAWHLAINSGQMPVHMYLPEERLVMDKLCEGDEWYICEIEQPSYRLKIWDEC